MDIFVFTGVRETKVGCFLQQWSWKTLNLLLHEHYARAAGVFIHPKIEFVYKCLPMPIRLNICRVLERCLLSDTRRHEICYNTWHSVVGKAGLKSQTFSPANRKLYEFENSYFYGPANAEECLTTWYGDWKKLPPVEERVQHGDIIVDLKNNYTKYMKKL